MLRSEGGGGPKEEKVTEVLGSEGWQADRDVRIEPTATSKMKAWMHSNSKLSFFLLFCSAFRCV